MEQIKYNFKSSATVGSKETKKELNCDAEAKSDLPLVILSAVYPFIKDDAELPKLKKEFDKFYEKIALSFSRYAETTLLTKAKKAFLSVGAESFSSFGCVMRFIPSFESEDCVSIVLDGFIHNGKAEHKVERYAHSWSKQTGFLMTCSDFLGEMKKKEILPLILCEAKRQIEAGVTFYSDYEKLIERRFDCRNFFPTPEGYAFFYPSGVLGQSNTPSVFVVKI